MQITEIMPDLRSYIREHFKVTETDADFTDDVHLFDYGYVDSFGAVDLTTFVEERFSIQISEADMVVYPLNTIREIAIFISRRKSGEI
jgi:D-alanine--poly(phosphoribitol) ligase subunit 2